jgi:tRNA pseudouridine55 synthase
MAISIPISMLPVFSKKTQHSFDETFDWQSGAAILVDKPQKKSSFSVVHDVRKLVPPKKVGHAGTLDPMATGLLILCAGRGTKSISQFQELSKTYRATFQFGNSTPSYDAETEADNEADFKHITEQLIEKELKSHFSGEIMQKAPKFSALKIQGKRAYKLAHKGRLDEIPDRIRPVSIFNTTIHSYDSENGVLDITIQCGKGTYIRSIAHDLGIALDSLAYMTQLRRTQIGDFSVDDAFSISTLQEILPGQ